MIRATVRADELDDLIGDLDVFIGHAADLSGLAEKVVDAVYVQNLEARMGGVDKDGQDFAELAPSTWAKWDRGVGPPLAPMESESRIISGFEVVPVVVSPTQIDVVGSWPSMDHFLGYHVTGTKYMPQRDPVGITPRGWAQIADAFDAWLDTLAGV